MIVQISKYIFNKVLEFAQERIKGSSDLYAARGELKLNKQTEDCVVGTLGEYGVYQFLRGRNVKCSKPDLNIYCSNEKSFGADLKTDKYNIHVKSQGLKSIKRYGHSWLFQRFDSLVNNPNSYDIIAFTAVDIDNREVEILGFCKATDLTSKNLWSECKVWSFRKTKVALYLTEILPYDIVFPNLKSMEEEK